ncbi:MAG TPA: winged helix-turn-helix domain-containing protein, partial [Rhodanobacteraceae bacterium]|nr:winged helix-turn-helix domain-containing protein [Rhodanobacteraceae bacterium]
MATRKVYEFGEVQLDPAQRRLEKKGEVVALHAKAFDALVYLVEHAGEAVSRRTLTEALWPKRVVEENNLTQAISALRRALGDDCIVTLAGRGYQFVADVRTVDVNPSGEAAPTTEPSSDSRASDDGRLAREGQLVHASAWRLWRRALATAAAVAVGAVLAGALVASVVGKPESTLPVTRFEIKTLPSAPLANLGGYDVIISPDGRRIAYVGRNVEGDSVALYVREMDGLEARLVPGTELANVIDLVGGGMNPFFSADSRSIGFMSPDRGVMRVSIDGGPPIKMFDAPAAAFFGASWGAGDTIVYSAGHSLHRASAGGAAAPERLTEEMPNALVVSPVALPGGRAVMYGLIEGGVPRVAVLDLETREQKTIVENGQSAFYSDTGHVVFARGTTIMAAPFDASEIEVTGEPVAIIENVRHTTAGPEAATDFALSASGTLVYVPTSGIPPDVRTAVVWVDRTG